MHYTALLSLLVVPVMSKALKYHVPSSLQARACQLPANFTVSDLTIYTDDVDNNKNYTSFSYSDVGTGIDTYCSRNSTSKPGTVNEGSWPCDNSNVAFIYDATVPKSYLTIVEIACPETGVHIEASGEVRPDLTCKNSTSGSTCVAKQSSMTGIFVSLEPTPPPSR
ncbi:hypothetical protein F4818DRAFT_400979 [Hypoxylon cercidicola]|nr:hypothetical protein F4818DRAFT_400979 [Hypoxylon cercidicola]